MTNKTVASRVRAYIKANPKATNKEVATALDVRSVNVANTRWRDKKLGVPKRVYEHKKKDEPVHVVEPFRVEIGTVLGGLTLTDMGGGMARWVREAPSDPVNHPAHYKVGGIETIDFIEAKQLNYNLGNVVKYLTRADHKGNQLQDLQKAQWYLAREIERVQS